MVLPDELLIVPALPVVPVPVDGVALDEPDVPLEPLVEPVPVAPMEDVPPVPLVSLLAVPVPLVLGDVELALPVMLPVLPELPVVVDGVVLDELVAPVDPAVPLSVPRWQALRDRAATTARTAVAVWVMVVFIRNSLLEMGCVQRGTGSPNCPEVTLGRWRGQAVGTACIHV